MLGRLRGQVILILHLYAVLIDTGENYSSRQKLFVCAKLFIRANRV